MANPQVAHGYTRIAHELLMGLVASSLSSLELRAVLYVARSTYGAVTAPKTAAISAADIAKATNTTRARAAETVRDLLARGVLVEERAPTWRVARRIGIQKDFDRWWRVAAVPRSARVSEAGTISEDGTLSEDGHSIPAGHGTVSAQGTGQYPGSDTLTARNPLPDAGARAPKDDETTTKTTDARGSRPDAPPSLIDDHAEGKSSTGAKKSGRRKHGATTSEAKACRAEALDFLASFRVRFVAAIGDQPDEGIAEIKIAERLLQKHRRARVEAAVDVMFRRHKLGRLKMGGDAKAPTIKLLSVMYADLALAARPKAPAPAADDDSPEAILARASAPRVTYAEDLFAQMFPDDHAGGNGNGGGAC
ncbi:MAG: replication protein [Polyangiaceae bacterium]